MLEIETFIRTAEGGTPLAAFAGSLDDADYIEGRITLRIKGREFLGERTWDCVDQLWAYFADGVTAVVAGEAFSTYFPDQPIQVEFLPDAHAPVITVRITIDEPRSATLDRRLFIATMAKAGSAAMHRFAALTATTGGGTYAEYAARLDAIAARV